jgi:glycosyltransferase involved in cell wall biosynthesis
MKISKISVVIWAYKRNEMLTQALNSVLNQHGFSEIVSEIIVSDNSPEGEAYEVVKSVGRPDVKYIQQQPSLSPQAHLPALLDLVKGKWCAHLCDDDIWLPWHLIEAVKSISRTNSKMYFGGRIHTGLTNLRYGVIDSSPFFLADEGWLKQVSYEDSCAALAFETHLMLSAMIVYVSSEVESDKVKTTVVGTHPLRADAAYFAMLMPDEGILFNSRPTIIYRKHGGQSAFSLKDHQIAQNDLLKILCRLLDARRKNLRDIILESVETDNITKKVYCSSNWWRIAEVVSGTNRPLKGWKFIKAKLEEVVRHHGLDRYMTRIKQII